MTDDEQLNIMYSGGASGADTVWGKLAKEDGQYVAHFVFKGHGTKVPKDDQYVLSDSDLKLGDRALIEANKKLGRTFPTSKEYVNNLLRRNYVVGGVAERVYAVGEIDHEKQLVKGGTAWAIQVYLDRGGDEAYMYDIPTSSWYFFDNLKWEKLETDPPKPHGRWAGIGTRDLDNPNRKHALEAMYKLFKKEVK